MPFVVGENVGPYRLLEQLGRGGMATVFKAYHPALDRYVAIKALHPAFLEDPNFHARFQREARVVAKLEHPNIVPIYDFSEHEGRPYLVMKFIEGETLKARLMRDALSVEEILEIVQAVGDALAYAHQQGILHRDIKPSNVLLSSDGRIYLADFGLARIAQAGESTISGDVMLGTPQYISPEQAMGLADLDEGTDIYSFGVMVYEMVVGQVPFSADTPFSIIHDHIYSPLPLPTRVNPNVPPAVERVLLKALAKEREARYERVSDFVTAFRQAVEESGAAMQALRRPVSEDAGTIPPLRLSESAETRAARGEPQRVEGEVPTKPATSSAPARLQDERREQEAAVVEEKPPARRRPLRWWQVLGLIVVVLFCGVVTLGALDSQRRQANLTPAASEGEVETESVPPVAGEEPSAAQIAQMQERFNALYEDGNWVGAARYAVELRMRYPQNPEIVPTYAFHEVVLRAAVVPDAMDVIPLADVVEIEPLLGLTAQARYNIYHGDVDLAQELLDQAFAINPDSWEAKLVQIELYAHERRWMLVRRLVEELKVLPDLPDWVQRVLENLDRRSVDQGAGEAMSMEEAKQNVEANPSDPWAHLAMAEAMINAGEIEGVDVEMGQVMELGVAANDQQVLFDAAELLRRNGVYLYALDFLLVGIHLGGGDIDTPTLDVLFETAYLAVDEPDAKQHLADLSREFPIDPFLNDVVLARYTILHGDLAIAEEMIHALMESNPGAPEVDLLLGEYYAVSGDPDKARDLFTSLSTREGVPKWIRGVVGMLMERYEL
ncbi:MAG: serine/threonine protein kinase [Anaerolineae bacterium]|nr:MAG: serine/threonine protein kinase [Anaerolineae bacterium]